METNARATEPEKINITIDATATLAEWVAIKKALEKGKEGYYGPEQLFIWEIKDVIDKAKAEFYASTKEEQG
jgi:hypothetical protein